VNLSRKATLNRIACSALAIPDRTLFAAKELPEPRPVCLHIFNDMPTVDSANRRNRPIAVEDVTFRLVRDPLFLCIQDNFIGRRFDLTVGHRSSLKYCSKDIYTAANTGPCGTYRCNSTYCVQSMQGAAVAASA